MKVHLKFELVVEYESHGASHDELVMRLRNCAGFLADRGMLTGESDAVVESWDCAVTDILY